MPYTGETLYHYTSTEALMSICQTLTLRATKLGYFSDGGELEYGLSYAMRLVSERRQEANDATKLRLDRLTGELKAFQGANIFVCSFSQHGDQLGQWRGYSTFGRAYSLAFAANQLTIAKSASGLGWTLEKCIYDVGEQHRAVSDVIDRFATTSGANPNNYAYELVQVAARLKHPSFQAEDEVRLVSSLLSEGGATTIQYRPGRYTLVPYVELQLPPDSVSSVTVGPTSQLALSISATAGYLRSINKPLAVYGTTTTFREW